LRAQSHVLRAKDTAKFQILQKFLGQSVFKNKGVGFSWLSFEHLAVWLKLG
jgi:hypothetical protein